MVLTRKRILNQPVRHDAPGIQNRQIPVQFDGTGGHLPQDGCDRHQTEFRGIPWRCSLVQHPPALVFQTGQAAVRTTYHGLVFHAEIALQGKAFERRAAGEVQSQHEPHTIHELPAFRSSDPETGVMRR